jgi:hypothetical protein
MDTLTIIHEIPRNGDTEISVARKSVKINLRAFENESEGYENLFRFAGQTCVINLFRADLLEFDMEDPEDSYFDLDGLVRFQHG